MKALGCADHHALDDHDDENDRFDDHDLKTVFIERRRMNFRRPRFEPDSRL
jgi:hypothetical protein